MYILPYVITENAKIYVFNVTIIIQNQVDYTLRDTSVEKPHTLPTLIQGNQYV